MIRFVIYGLLGWCGEIVFTAVHDAWSGHRQGEGDLLHTRRPITRGDRVLSVGRTYLSAGAGYIADAIFGPFIGRPLLRLLPAAAILLAIWGMGKRWGWTRPS